MSGGPRLRQRWSWSPRVLVPQLPPVLQCGNKEGARKYPVATLKIQKRTTQRVELPRGPRRRKGAQRPGLEGDAKI